MLEEALPLAIGVGAALLPAMAFGGLAAARAFMYLGAGETCSLFQCCGLRPCPWGVLALRWNSLFFPFYFFGVGGYVRQGEHPFVYQHEDAIGVGAALLPAMAFGGLAAARAFMYLGAVEGC